MSTLGEYIIPYLGLANGIHSYTFRVDKDFFKHFETSKVREGQLTLHVDFDKLDRIVTLDIKCDGTFRASCDRCASEIDIAMSYEDQVILKLEDARTSDKAEVIFLDPKTSEIDLAPVLYESMHLHLPMVNLKDCESNDYKDCDHEILDRLEGVYKEEGERSSSDVWSELDKLNLNKD